LVAFVVEHIMSPCSVIMQALRSRGTKEAEEAPSAREEYRCCFRIYAQRLNGPQKKMRALRTKMDTTVKGAVRDTHDDPPEAAAVFREHKHEKKGAAVFRGDE